MASAGPSRKPCHEKKGTGKQAVEREEKRTRGSRREKRRNKRGETRLDNEEMTTVKAQPQDLSLCNTCYSASQ